MSRGRLALLLLVLVAWIAVIAGTGVMATLAFQRAPSAAEAASGDASTRAARAAAARSNGQLFHGSAALQLALAGLGLALAAWPPRVSRTTVALVACAALAATVLALVVTPRATAMGRRIADSVAATGRSGLSPAETASFRRLHGAYAGLAIFDLALLHASLAVALRASRRNDTSGAKRQA